MLFLPPNMFMSFFTEKMFHFVFAKIINLGRFCSHSFIYERTSNFNKENHFGIKKYLFHIQIMKTLQNCFLNTALILMLKIKKNGLHYTGQRIEVCTTRRLQNENYPFQGKIIEINSIS